MEEGRDRIINVAARKTEGEWARAAQAFFEKATPTWFKWLGWVLATGAVAYIAKVTDDLALKIIEGFCYILLTAYFFYFFASIRIEPIHSKVFETNKRWQRALGILLLLLVPLLMVYGTRSLIEHVVALLVAVKKY
jgi:hypothetical protein